MDWGDTGTLVGEEVRSYWTFLKGRRIFQIGFDGEKVLCYFYGDIYEFKIKEPVRLISPDTEKKISENPNIIQAILAIKRII